MMGRLQVYDSSHKEKKIHVKPYDNLARLLFFWLGSDGARVERWLDELALAIFYSWMVTIFGNLLEKGVNFI